MLSRYFVDLKPTISQGFQFVFVKVSVFSIFISLGTFSVLFSPLLAECHVILAANKMPTWIKLKKLSKNPFLAKSDS